MQSITFEKALAHFREVCGNASAEQEKLLRRLMEQNSECEYGRRYGFKDIHNAKEYASLVPLTEFGDYDGNIQRIIDGERNILSSIEPYFFNISAGSTGESKYIPLCREDIEKQHLYEDCAVCGIIAEEMADCTEEELFGCIFNLGDFFITNMPDGVLNGVRSGAYFRMAYEENTFDGSVFCTPKEVMFPHKMEDMLYVKLRFALANRDITAIHGVFIHRTVGVMRYIKTHWNELIYDIEHGTVSDCFSVNDTWREYLRRTLPPDPERAAELKSIDRADLSDGMLKKIWKKLKYIRTIEGTLFSAFEERFRRYIGDLPVHNFAYASSESNIGIAPRMNVPDEYVLLPDVCVFEFIPEEQMTDPKDILTLSEVETGKRYELVITTLSGLYRYRIGDVVEIVGKYGEAPAVKVCYRKNLVISICDEHMNISQFESAMMDFCRRTGVSVDGFCVTGDYSDVLPRYLMYIDSVEALPENAEKTLDECFCENNLWYKGAREMSDLGCTEIRAVIPGTFRQYEKICWSNGKRNEQAKPLRILTNSEQLQFFEKSRR